MSTGIWRLVGGATAVALVWWTLSYFSSYKRPHKKEPLETVVSLKSTATSDEAHAPDGTSENVPAPDTKLLDKRVIVPTRDWTEIFPGDICPPGCEFRMDFSTGKNFVRTS